MDTTDPAIVYDENGQCSHCQRQEIKLLNARRLHQPGNPQLKSLFARIKEEGKGKQYDAVLGVSGGVDSSYLAYLLSENRIRTLAVHLDNGWNSELAVQNIYRSVDLPGIDLYTHVLDWEEFRDLQLSFLKASVVDIEMLTDHAIKAVVFKQAAKWKIQNVITGFNVETEGNMPASWVHNKLDAVNIRAIHRSHGLRTLRTYPTAGNITHELLFKRLHRIRQACPLNYIPYDKDDVMRRLESLIGWKPYRGKHYESSFTEFFQGYILPRKFGIDKRRPHLSALITAGRITRAEALNELSRPLFSAERLRHQYEFVLKKWELTAEKLEEYLDSPPQSHRDYACDNRRVALWEKGKQFSRRITRAA